MAKKAASEGTKGLDESCRIVLLTGEDGFLRQLYTAELRKSLEKAHGEVDTVNFDGVTARAADVLDECRSFGLIARHKMVIVDDADQVVKEDSRPLFERYASSPTDGTTLVLRGRIWRAGKLDKMIEEVGAIKKCDAVSHEQAVGWAVTRCAKEHGGTMGRDAAELLVSRVGTELGGLDSEIGKLAAAAGQGKDGKPNPITPALVAEFVGVSREESAWAIQSVLLSGSTQTNLRAIETALDVSRHPAQLVFYACIDLARKLHGCAAGLKGGTPRGDLFRTFKLFGTSGDSLMNAASRMGPSRARRLLSACVEADARHKSGLGDAERNLERLAIEFAESVKGR